MAATKIPEFSFCLLQGEETVNGTLFASIWYLFGLGLASPSVLCQLPTVQGKGGPQRDDCPLNRSFGSSKLNALLVCLSSKLSYDELIHGFYSISATF